MKLSHLPIFLVLGIVYGIVLYVVQGFVPKPVILSLITATGIITLSSFFMRVSSKNHDASAGAQKFIIGTTVQILLSLGFLLYSRVKFGPFYKEIAIHFMILFVVSLIVQCFLLIRSLRKS